jgi:hypothetical protein
MANRCLTANPDVSGIGVRVAIYAQNLLCFAPVVADLWDGEVSADEIKGIADQSIGMLCIAFAILLTAMVEARTTTPASSNNRINGFDAAIVLNLSWMNNTSTFIWFLLYVHQQSKSKIKRIPATFADWTNHLVVEPLRQSTRPKEPAAGERNVLKRGKQRLRIGSLSD